MAILSQQHDRFKDATWFPKEKELVMIGGAGGIGSWLTLALTRLGFTPVVYDFDIIEEHNTGGQLFRASDIGSYKVSALQNIIKDFCGVEINSVIERIDQNTASHFFMFSAFDNMKARRDMFEVWKKSIPGCPITPILIDGRLEMEQFQVFAVTPDRVEEYEKYLFDDSRVEDAPCTMKQSTHFAMMIAGHMAGIFTNHYSNIVEREVIRDVPFFYAFSGPGVITDNAAYA